MKILFKHSGDVQQTLAYKLITFVMNCTGDAVFNILQILLHMSFLKYTKENVRDLFVYKKSLTYTLKVGNRLAVETNEKLMKVVRPVELEELVQSTCNEHKDSGLRIFIRPSGTEDMIRLHLEADNDAMFTEVRKRIDTFLLQHPLINPPETHQQK